MKANLRAADVRVLCRLELSLAVATPLSIRHALAVALLALQDMMYRAPLCIRRAVRSVTVGLGTAVVSGGPDGSEVYTSLLRYPTVGVSFPVFCT